MTPSSKSLVLVALILLSFVCLGSWVTTFKLAGKRWRYELFSIDFVLGTVFSSLLIAFTLGNMGSDLPFSDRLILASKTSQALLLSAGFIFGLANLLLMGAAALLGVAGSFPLCLGLAVIVHAFLNFRSYSPGIFLAGLSFLVAGVILAAVACRSRDVAATVTRKAPNQSAGAKGVRSLKGLIVAVIGGVLLGVIYSLAEGGIYGDLGLGVYAGLVFFCAGMLVSTLAFSVFSFNIALEGSRLALRSYFGGQRRQHLFGIAGGGLWSVGILATFLAVGAAADVRWQQILVRMLPFASMLLTVSWGMLMWKEFAAAPKKAPLLLTGTAAVLVGSFLLIGLTNVR